MIIGGAEDKVRKPTILKHFVTLSGGRDASIAVIPTALMLFAIFLAIKYAVLAINGDKTTPIED